MDCGFTFTADAPDMQAIGPYYKHEDYISHSDTRRSLTDHMYHFARSIMLRRKKNVVGSLREKPGRLLDIGSGTGYFPHTMRNAGWSVSGVEVDADARQLSISKFDLEVAESFQDADFEKASIDVISMWHVLEHVHGLNDYWKMFDEVLDPNGHLVIAVPNLKSVDAQYYGSFWAAYDVPRHLWHFSHDDMKRLGEKHGFQLYHSLPMPLDAFYVSILSEKYKGSDLQLLKGLWRGLLSYIKAKDVKASSSIIYIFKKIK